MKIICLNIQDCGYVKQVHSKEISNSDMANPFGKCPTCNYYTVIIDNNADINLDIAIFKKLYKQIRKNE